MDMYDRLLKRVLLESVRELVASIDAKAFAKWYVSGLSQKSSKPRLRLIQGGKM